MSEEHRHPAYVWWNGKQVRWEDATIHVTELGWSTVGAVFEGIRAYWNAETESLNIFRLREHLERLEDSMRLVRLRLDYSVEELTEIIVALLQANDVREDTYIRPLGYTLETSGKRFAQVGGESGLLINTHAMPTHLQTGVRTTAKVSSWRRISEDVMPPRIKNIANYRNGQLASAEAAINGYDMAILLNMEGKVAEGAGACIMMVRDGKLVTPSVTDSILESITRTSIMELAQRELGIEVVERTIDRTELYIADEVFFCGTAAEITPVISVDRYVVGNGDQGPVTTELEKRFHDIVRGKDERYSSWVTPVGARKAVAAD